MTTFRHNKNNKNIRHKKSMATDLSSNGVLNQERTENDAAGGILKVSGGVNSSTRDAKQVSIMLMSAAEIAALAHDKQSSSSAPSRSCPEQKECLLSNLTSSPGDVHSVDRTDGTLQESSLNCQAPNCETDRVERRYAVCANPEISTARAEIRTRRFLPGRKSAPDNTSIKSNAAAHPLPPPPLFSPKRPFMAKPFPWGGRQVSGAPRHPYRGNSCPPCPPRHKLICWWSVFAHITQRRRKESVTASEKSNANQIISSHSNPLHAMSYATLLRHTPRFLMSKQYHAEYRAACKGGWSHPMSIIQKNHSAHYLKICTDDNTIGSNESELEVEFLSLTRPVFRGFHPGFVHYWTSPSDDISVSTLSLTTELATVINSPLMKDVRMPSWPSSPESTSVQQKKAPHTADGTIKIFDSGLLHSLVLYSDRKEIHVDNHTHSICHPSRMMSRVEDPTKPQFESVAKSGDVRSHDRFQLFSRAKEALCRRNPVENDNKLVTISEKEGVQNEERCVGEVVASTFSELSPVRPDWVHSLVDQITQCTTNDAPFIPVSTRETQNPGVSPENSDDKSVPMDDSTASKCASNDAQAPKVLIAQLHRTLSDKMEYIKKLRGRIHELRDERDAAVGETASANEALSQLRYTFELNKKNTAETLKSSSRLAEENASLRLSVQELSDALRERVTRDLSPHSRAQQGPDNDTGRLGVLSVFGPTLMDGVSQTTLSDVDSHVFCTNCNSYRSQRDAALAKLKDVIDENEKNNKKWTEDEKKLDLRMADKTKEIQAKVAGDLARKYKEKLNVVQSDHQAQIEKVRQEEWVRCNEFFREKLQMQDNGLSEKIKLYSSRQVEQMNRKNQSRFDVMQASHEQDLLAEKEKYHRLQLRYEEDMRGENDKVIKLTKEVVRLRDSMASMKENNSLAAAGVTAVCCSGNKVSHANEKTNLYYFWMHFLFGLQRVKYEIDLRQQQALMTELTDEIKKFKDEYAQCQRLEAAKQNTIHVEMLLSMTQLEQQRRLGVQVAESNARVLINQLCQCDRAFLDLDGKNGKQLLFS